MFAAIVVDKNNTDLKQQKGKIDNMMLTNNTVNFNALKSIKKQQTDEAYRSIFMKTLRGKK